MAELVKCPKCDKVQGYDCTCIVDTHLVLVHDVESKKWVVISECVDEDEARKEFNKLQDGTPKIILYTGDFIQF